MPFRIIRSRVAGARDAGPMVQMILVLWFGSGLIG